MIYQALAKECHNQNYTFAPIPTWLITRTEVSLAAKTVYARLLQYAGKSSIAFPTRETLCQEVGANIRTVDRLIKELKECNLIHVRQNGCNKSNTYELLSHIWMKEGKTYNAPPKKEKVCTNNVTPELQKTASPYNGGKDKVKDNILNFPKKSFEGSAAYSGEFEEWWKAYPNQVHKRRAYQEFCVAINHTDLDILIKKAKAYGRKVRDKDEFLLNPENWLKEAEWESNYGKYEKEPSKSPVVPLEREPYWFELPPSVRAQKIAEIEESMLE